MSLRFALLVLLREEEATGYELAKRFDVSVSHFWHATPQQIYQELGRMEDDGLIRGEVVIQEKRPNKRVYSITEQGSEALGAWQRERSPIAAIKSELLVKVYGSDSTDSESLLASLAEQIEFSREKLRQYEAIRDLLLRGRDEETFLRTTRHAGPYLALRRGFMFEQENIAWSEWVSAAIQRRSRGQGSPSRSQRGRTVGKVAAR
jgi:DNA-binding PadR family transcriptional regulator